MKLGTIVSYKQSAPATAVITDAESTVFNRKIVDLVVYSFPFPISFYSHMDLSSIQDHDCVS